MSEKTTSLNDLFEQAANRLARGKSLKNPYGAGPIASDHFLLSKAWVYFQERMKTLEEQNRELLKSKETQIKSLQKQNEEYRKELENTHLKNKEQDSVAVQLSEARIRDLLSMEKRNEGLIKRWDEEKLALIESNQQVEFKLKELLKDLETMKNLAVQKDKVRKELQKEIGESKEVFQQKIAELNQEKLSLNKQREEEVGAFNRKIDLLKKEVDYRDRLLKEQTVELNERGKDNESDKAAVRKQAEIVSGLQKENSDLRQQMDTLKSQQEEMRRVWRDEQSEWRELWERQREMWEHKTKDR